MRTPLDTVTSLDDVQAAVPPASARQRGTTFTSLDDVQVASPCTADWKISARKTGEPGAAAHLCSSIFARVVRVALISFDS